MLVVKNVIFLFIRSQMAESGPPLGTVLGNIGINALKFCKEFNEFTKDLPSYFLLKVKIIILEDRSFSFSVFLPTTGYLLSLLKVQKSLGFYLGKELKENYIMLKQLVQLAKLKFPNFPLGLSIKIVLGSVKSSNLIVKNHA